MEYSQIFKILKTKIDDLISDKISDEFDNASSGNGKEVEHKSYSGFIPYTDGGYEYTWFEYLRDYYYGNLRLPTDKLIKEADGFVEYNLELARENFAEKYPEITERLGGVDNVYYSNLEDADYRDEAEELQDMEYNSFDEDTVMMEVAAYYYKPDNSRAIDNKHTIYVFGTVNLEAPYHRHGNNDDSLGFEFTFDSLGELKKQMNRYLKEIHAWFNGEAISKKKPKTDETKTNYSSFFSQYSKGGKTNFMNTRKMMYGGDTYDEGDAISRAKSKAFFEHDFVADAIEYVGGIDEWNKLSESEKQSIIADEERGWNERFLFSRGGLFGVSAKVKDLSDEFGSDSLKDELKEKLGVNSDDVSDLDVLAFAYTDYGGDFFDKVAIAYFLENYPDNIVVENTMYNGENAFVFGEPAKEYMEQTEKYHLGFEYLEDKYYDMQTDVEHEGFTYFIEDLDKDKYDFDAQKVFDWLVENKSGYYSVLTSGLDYSESDLIKELENEGIIEEIYEGGSSFFDKYAKGGLTRNEILKLYHKDSLSDAENEKINNAIEKGIIDTDYIREDNMAYIYTRIEKDFGDEVSNDMIWDFTDENLSNGLTHKQNYENLLEYLKDTHGIVKMGGKKNPYSSFFSQFAKGGGVNFPKHQDFHKSSVSFHTEGDYDLEIEDFNDKLNTIHKHLKFDSVVGESDSFVTNLKFYKNDRKIASINGKWNEYTSTYDSEFIIHDHPFSINFHPMGTLGGFDQKEFDKEIKNAVVISKGREKTPYSSFFSQFAKGGKTKKNKPSLNYTHPLDIRILEAVYYDRIDALMGILPYYLKGADRYFNEQKRGNPNREIAKIYNEIDKNYQDLAELSANGFPIDLNVSHKMALDYVYDLEGLYNSYQGRVIWGTDDEVENEKNYARYVEILEEITEYVHNKYGSTYKSGGSIRKFSNGGGTGSDPQIYVVDAEAYSKGRDMGEWLTLTDYDDGDEVIEKIEELMLKWSRRQKKKVEEYLIAESINIDDSLISESMDADDFTKAIQVSKAEQSSSIPVDVLIQVYDDFSPDDLADWIDNNYWGRADDDEDFGRQLIDSMGSPCDALGDNIDYYFDYEKFGSDESTNYSEYDGYYFTNYKRGGSIPNHKLRKQH